jgi:molecular chaperone GrpE
MNKKHKKNETPEQDPGIEALNAEAEDALIDGDASEDINNSEDGEDGELKLAGEVETLKDKLLRAIAEGENVRRRAERQVSDAATYAVTGFARELLAVSDNLRRALEALPEEMHDDERLKAFVEGVELTERELLNAFEKTGIKKIEPEGDEFDHNLHQAIFEVETLDAKPGTVVQVVQTGYVIKDRLLRPAMVGVAKPPKELENGVDESA